MINCFGAVASAATHPHNDPADVGARRTDPAPRQTNPSDLSPHALGTSATGWRAGSGAPRPLSPLAPASAGPPGSPAFAAVSPRTLSGRSAGGLGGLITPSVLRRFRKNRRPSGAPITETERLATTKMLDSFRTLFINSTRSVASLRQLSGLNRNDCPDISELGVRLHRNAHLTTY